MVLKSLPSVRDLFHVCHGSFFVKKRTENGRVAHVELGRENPGRHEAFQNGTEGPDRSRSSGGEGV